MTKTRTDRPSPTAEQSRALEVSGQSVALSAGAGCGKTFVLAERFVRALDGPDPHPLGRVVALTFTNKAARELRKRIRKECRARLELGQDQPRWRAVLRGLEAARIGTFHAFCGEILRGHAIEAGVDPGFLVFDETIALSIREEALASSLRDGLTSRDPDLMDLAVEFGLGMVRRSLDDLLGHRSSGDLRDWADRLPRELVDLWVEIWTSEVQPEMIARFRDRLRPCLELIDETDFDNPKVRERLARFSEAATLLDAPGDTQHALKQVEEAAKVQGLQAKAWPTPEIYVAIKDQFESIRNEAKKLVGSLDWQEPSTMLAADQGLKFARLAVKARETYDRAKRLRGGIDNDDLLLLTRDLLAARSTIVRDALAGSIDLILVDEFQDTDPVQSEILECLAGPGLLDGKLFLVGDYKQSIYRFRGAQPGLFHHYRERFPESGRLTLSENFRSTPAILDFVNALFASTFTEPNSALRPGGDWPAQDAPSAVEFLWASVDDPAPSAGPDARARRKQEARRLACHLKTRLDRGWTIRDGSTKGLRRANQGDVAILFRSLSDASDYEQAFAAEGLDYHVVGGSGFFAQQEVLDIINVLTAVEDPLDAVSLAGTLRSPFFSLSDDALYWLSTERIGKPHEGLARCDGPWRERLPEVDRPRAVRARRLLDGWRAVKDRLPIASLVDLILTESGYEAALIGEFLGDRKRANARKLVRMARRFDEQGGFTLADFVARLRADLRGATKETQAATTDEGGEIIRLMSIHQAKGLEFPIVVLPDLDRKRPGELKRVAFDPQLGLLVNPIAGSAEEIDGDQEETGGSLGWTIHRHRERLADDAEALRLFYVAATRAMDALVLSSATDQARPPTSPAMLLLDSRFDRSTGLMKASLPQGWEAPRIRVVPDSTSTGPIPASPSRQRPRLLDVAAMIRQSLEQSAPPPPIPSYRPRLIDLDPTVGLGSTAARLDRLVRSILADPRIFEAASLERIARRAALMQEPVSPQKLVDEALRRISAWTRTDLAREISRSGMVRRSVKWSLSWPESGEPMLFLGQADFVFRRPGDEEGLLIVSDPSANEARELLRLQLSALAVLRLGSGQINQAWWVRLGKGGGTTQVSRFDESELHRACEEALGFSTQID